MIAGTHEPVNAWRFIRANAVRIVIGLVLVAVSSVAVFIWMPHQRELRIVREIEALGGQVEFEYRGPPWIPESIQIRPSFLDRIHVTFPYMIAIQPASAKSQTYIRMPMPPALLSKIGSLNSLSHLYLSHTHVADSGIEHLKGLRNLCILDLDHTDVTDAGLEHLKGLNNLFSLSLRDTPVTDAGLPHLNGLKRMAYLNLNGTETTVKGRVSLRKALPNCKIEPDP